MSEEQLRDHEKILLEFESDLLKFEKYLQHKEEQINKKEEDVDQLIKSGQGMPKRPIESLVQEELKECLTKWQRRGVPTFKLMVEIQKSSWGKQTIGAYKHTLIIRKDAVRDRMKLLAERDKNRVKSASEHATSIWSFLTSFIGYLVILGTILLLAGPPFVMNLIRNEIAKGEWTHHEHPPADITDLET